MEKVLLKAGDTEIEIKEGVLGTINIIKIGDIEIEIKEGGVLKTINILKADECRIEFKGDFIHQNAKEIFCMVPVQIREQIRGHIIEQSYIETIREGTNGDTIFDINSLSGGEYVCTVKPKITDESKEYLEFYNCLLNAEKINNDKKNLNVEEYNNKVLELTNKAKEKGFIFEYNCEGDIYDDYYSLYVPVKEFNMNNVNEFLALWDAYNAELEALSKE